MPYADYQDRLAASRRYYEANKDRYKARAKARRESHPEERQKIHQKRYQERKAIICAAKDKPCVDCGVELPPEIMHLDHVRGEKSFDLGQANGRPIDVIKAEIAKCDVRCPTCHALRHFMED